VPVESPAGPECQRRTFLAHADLAQEVDARLADPGRTGASGGTPGRPHQ
jgi:hypothetical protein